MEAGVRLAALLDAIYAPSNSTLVEGPEQAQELLEVFAWNLEQFQAKRPEGPQFAPKLRTHSSPRLH
jgi:hypothetical protein